MPRRISPNHTYLLLSLLNIGVLHNIPCGKYKKRHSEEKNNKIILKCPPKPLIFEHLQKILAISTMVDDIHIFI